MKKKGDKEWNGATSLRDRIGFLVESGQTKTEEFQVFLRIYGRPKIEALWKQYLKEKKNG